MIYALIPIVFIAGIFIVFYLFKDKFMAKTVNTYNEAAQKWAEDKEGIISDFFSNPDKFKIVRDAVEKNIDCIVDSAPKKGIAGKILKGALEMATMRETFDMSLYYLAIAGDELHFLQSDGKMIIEHAVFDLNAIEEVEMKRDGGAMIAAKYIMNSGGSGQQHYWLNFTSNGKAYEFKVNEQLMEFPVYKIEKEITVNRKHGQNPFYRVSNVADIDRSLLSMYVPESVEKFNQKIESLIK